MVNKINKTGSFSIFHMLIYLMHLQHESDFYDSTERYSLLFFHNMKIDESIIFSSNTM